MGFELDLSAPPIPSPLAAVAAWLTQPWCPGIDPTWHLVADSDGAIGLVPTGIGGEHTPALLITARANGFDVTVCDTDSPEELGPFSGIEDALQGITRWLAPVQASAIDALGRLD